MAHITTENGYLVIRDDWHESDIQDAASNVLDRELTKAEIKKVMEWIVAGFDAEQGISWESIEMAIETVVGE
jgi:hypothetical protein